MSFWKRFEIFLNSIAQKSFFCQQSEPLSNDKKRIRGETGEYKTYCYKNRIWFTVQSKCHFKLETIWTDWQVSL